MAAHPFFLFIGPLTDAAVSKIKATGLTYVQKLLDSGPDNWDQIREYVTEEGLIGVIGRFRGSDFVTILSDSHRRLAEDLLSALGRQRHIVFIHETVFLGHDIPAKTAGPTRCCMSTTVRMMRADARSSIFSSATAST